MAPSGADVEPEGEPESEPEGFAESDGPEEWDLLDEPDLFDEPGEVGEAGELGDAAEAEPFDRGAEAEDFGAGVAGSEAESVAEGVGLAVSGAPGSTDGVAVSLSVRPEMSAQLAQGFEPSAARTFCATAICWARLARSGRAAYCVPPYWSQVFCENWSPP